MKFSQTIFALSLAITITACATADDGKKEFLCDQNPYMCGFLTAAAIGGIAAVIASTTDKDHAGSGGCITLCPISDQRLKYDVKKLGVLSNGLPYYTYKYLGSDSVFVGVMAQDLLADARYRSAVVTTASGYYAVDYSKLGYKLVNVEAMQAAGQRALALAGDSKFSQ